MKSVRCPCVLFFIVVMQYNSTAFLSLTRFFIFFFNYHNPELSRITLYWLCFYVSYSFVEFLNILDLLMNDKISTIFFYVVFLIEIGDEIKYALEYKLLFSRRFLISDNVISNVFIHSSLRIIFSSTRF